MDIGSLLAEADEEVAYDKDDFESFNRTADSAYLNASFDQKDDGEAPTNKPVSAASILQSAARIVEKEEAEEMKVMIKESVQEAAKEVEKIREEEELRTRTYSSDHDNDAANQMNILIDASKEVAEYHGQEIGDVVDASSEEEEVEADEEEEDDDDGEYDDIVNRDLIHACHKGDERLVNMLLKRDGVNLKHVDRHGWTAMHWAASKGHTEIMDLLMDHRRIKQQKPLPTLLNKQDKLAGWTPLHVAAVSGQKSAVQILLENKANKKKKSYLKELPYDVVGHGKHAKAIRMMLEVVGKKKKHDEGKEESKHHDRD